MVKFLRTAGLIVCLLFANGCATTPTEPRVITVMTYNIHHGEGTDGKLDLERIARIIRDQNADLVALQEVDENAERTGKVPQAEELGRLTGLQHVFGKAMDFGGGGYGQAILSRWPIKDVQVHQLPQRAGREPRILLKATIALREEQLAFCSAHLDHQLEEVRIEQVNRINEILKPGAAGSALLLAGDFNARPESSSIKSLLGQWTDTAGEGAAPTIPAGNPRSRIDYIFVAPQGAWRVIESKVLEEPIASDHRPVVMRAENPR